VYLGWKNIIKHASRHFDFIKIDHHGTGIFFEQKEDIMIIPMGIEHLFFIRRRIAFLEVPDP